MSEHEVDRFREQITEVDRVILEALNRRLELVAELRRYKEEHGIAFVDPEREARMVDDRVRDNPGPLSEDGLRAFYAELLAFTKRELGGF